MDRLLIWRRQDRRGKRLNSPMLFDLTDKLVWVAGQHGMVGRAMMRRLAREPCALLPDPGRTAVDLRRQSEVEDWICGRQDRRDQALSGLPSPAWVRFHIGDADESLRPRRQFPSRDQPRPGGTIAPLSRG